MKEAHTAAFGGDDSRGGVARSTSSQTVVIDGRSRTRTTTTIRHADGRVETFTDEHVDDGFPAARVGGRDRDAALPRGAGGRVVPPARRGVLLNFSSGVFFCCAQKRRDSFLSH